MFRKFLLLVLFTFSLTGFSGPNSLKISDIEKVMERFFSLHIENSELTPTIVRRCMKLYIEQLDPDKSYFLDSEVRAYLSMSDQFAGEVLERFGTGDYSDFYAINASIQQASIRARDLRTVVARQVAAGNFDFDPSPIASLSSYAQSEEQLLSRQASRMIRFFQYHEARTRLDTQERRAKVFALFEKKVRRIENNYLFLAAEDIPMNPERKENLVTLRILKAFAKSLDTHTSFFSPEEAHEMRMSLEKQFEGVGVVLTEGIDGVMIAELIKGSPAELSGQIKINDFLIAIDGKPTSNVSFEEVLEILKKKEHGDVVLDFKRLDGSSNEIFTVSLKKRPIAMEEERINTSYEKFGDGIIGKIALHSFYENSNGLSSEKDLKDAIRQFREIGELKGLVLDLRENSGGFLSQAVKVAGLFVSNGVVVISKYGKGEAHYLRNISGKSFYNGPLVILTSKMSASAAEIVAQALQDYGVALVVGDKRTFGKGSIQYQTVTDAKADMFFKITVGRYYTPSGKSTQIDGVIADIVVPTQYAPYNIGEMYLEYPLPPDHVAAAFVDPLTDLDEKAQIVFQKRYLPYLQKVVSFWKRMLPALAKNSAERLAKDPKFQAYLKYQEKVRARQEGSPPNSIDEQLHISLDDLPANEAVNIVKDMIELEAERHEGVLLRTGSD